MHIRGVGPEDRRQYDRLGLEGFGELPLGAPSPDPAAQQKPGKDAWAAFDERGAMTARMALYQFQSWWHGAPVRTGGVCNVSVAPENRGDGVLQPLFAAALGASVERGEVLSTLFPTANGIYRGLGYELVSSLDTVEVPVAELGRVAPPTRTRTRRATAADIGAVTAIYDTWAAAQNGPLTRTGPRFDRTDQQLLDRFTAITVAVTTDDEVVGYASWNRGAGYDPASAALDVQDLIAVTLDGYRALWTMLGSWTSVLGAIRLRTSGEDPARLVVPTSAWKVIERHPYMLRINDPAAALTAAGLGIPGLSRTITFAVAGDRLGMADGCFRWSVGEEAGVCERVPAVRDVPTFTPQGLAMAFAGVQSCANLRLTEHLTGPREDDALIDALLGGRPAHIRNYF